ncbi:MAG: hypothetical protein A2798_01175 [Candidatus Levybacteria bacterium RIFCSPHIGHO2_01_FULL_37_17]|nr:MAG: hypothetical protein A2798_01175 [Candidatus Levybacteria bacterium RIFCSPHIGHO2_01_FULL_37_17]OGH37064.1 MAG: hypothetical protein A2959_02035 [Candidatus Levybacteria bacterium RIFCSPLOWO2_01_FULL_38_23]
MIEAPVGNEIAERYPQVKKVLEWFVPEGEPKFAADLQLNVRHFFNSMYFHHASFWKENYDLEILPENQAIQIARDMILQVTRISEENGPNRAAAKEAIAGGHGVELLFQTDGGFNGIDDRKTNLYQFLGVASLIGIALKSKEVKLDFYLKYGIDSLARSIPYRTYREKNSPQV